MHDPIAIGRRGAMRAVAVSLVTTAAVALVMMVFVGPAPAGAVMLGGLGMLVGNLASILVALRGGFLPARAAFARLVLGAFGKWLLVVALVAMKSPALPLLAGLLVAELAYLLALGLMNGRLQDKGTRRLC